MKLQNQEHLQVYTEVLGNFYLKFNVTHITHVYNNN